MGFIKEVYANNRASLIVSFNGSGENYFETDSIEEAIKHFKLYREGNSLFVKTKEEAALEEVDLLPQDVPAFREKVDTLITLLDDDAAIQNAILFPTWKANIAYNLGERIRYNNLLYKVLQTHTSQANWTPDVASSLYAQVLSEDPNIVIDWTQPNSTNGYSAGTLVKHNNKIWMSTANNNVWEPGALNAPWVEYNEAAEEWNPEKIYSKDDVVIYKNEHWQSLVNENTTEPDVANWKKIASDSYPEYMSGQLYMIGDIVFFEGNHYKSLIDNNVWSPAGYPAGWELV